MALIGLILNSGKGQKAEGKSETSLRPKRWSYLAPPVCRAPFALCRLG